MSLFAELNKRRVFATAAIYIPGAWLIAEILLAIVERFSAPAWAGDIVVVVFLLGFPVALLLSWLFDFTSAGVKRSSPGTPLGIVVILASGLFLSVASYISYQVFSGRISEVRIAVLPLKANTASEAVQPYSSGIADGIRSALREVSVLRVPALTSSEAVSRAGLDIPAIATRLGVEYVLEGTLEMVGNNVNVAVTLLDDGGEVLWSERYQRATRDLFDLQNDLVRAVAMQLGVPESDHSLQAQIRKQPPTSDPEAHRLYLRGKYLAAEATTEEDDPSLLVLKQARDRDPGYAAVYSAIALNYALKCWGLDDRKHPSCELAVNYANQGLLLDPQMADALAVLAMVHSVRYEWDLAQHAIDRFNDAQVNDVISHALPAAYVNLGRTQLAWDAGLEFYANDPLNAFAAGPLAIWGWSLLQDQALSDHYDAIVTELMPLSILAAFPEIRKHRVPLQEAIEQGRRSSMFFGNPPGWADLIIPAIYDPSLAESAAIELDKWVADGKIREAQYWGFLPSVGRTDQFVEMAFDQYDQNILNPVLLWIDLVGADQIRAHPRYIELMEYIGIADYWDQHGWPAFCEMHNGERQCGPGPSATSNK